MPTTATMTTTSDFSKKLTIKDVNVNNKNILIRVDYNVPLEKLTDGTMKVTDESRIAATIPTLKYLIKGGAKRIVIISHLGRPDGEIKPAMSLKPVTSVLSNLLSHKQVHFINDCVGESVPKSINDIQKDFNEECPIFLLENLRFHLEEEGSVKKKDGSKLSTSKEAISHFRFFLSSLGEIYVNDAFGAAHRAHSSIVGVSIEPKVAGLLIAKELIYFGRILTDPNGIDLAILGGAKVADKIQLILNLLPRVRKLVIGSAMSFTFWKVIKGMNIGNSIFDEEGAKVVPLIMDKAKELGVEIVLAVDFLAGDKFDNNVEVKYCTVEEGIPEGWIGMDMGRESIKYLSQIINSAKSILWNGPVGVFEFEKFSHGTRQLISDLLQVTKDNEAITVVGGGESCASVIKFYGNDGVKGLSHVSTGGGASLELLEGKELPGISILSDKP